MAMMQDISRLSTIINSHIPDTTVTARNVVNIILAFFASASLQKGVVILTYHSIGSNGDFYTVNPDAFNRQMEYLRHNYSIVPLSDVVDFAKCTKEMPRKSVSITFDDGYQDFYSNAYPYFRKYRLPATVFVTTGYVGKEWAFNEYGLKMLTWDEIEEISKNSIEIGAHTVTHPNLQVENRLRAECEIIESKKEIEKHLKKSVRFFSCPFGMYTDRILEIVRNSDFEAAVSGLGTVHKGSCLFALNRVQIDQSTSFLQFQARLTKAVDWSVKIEQIVRILLGRRQVLPCSHDGA